MRTDVHTKGLILALGLSASVAGCAYEDPDPFTEPMVLGGVEVDAQTLNRGREGYVLYCYACHGMEGDGNGPAAYALRPPPRNFRTAMFKFAGVAEGLPHDEDLKRIIVGGLKGTAMLEWDIPDTVLNDIVQYLKTFSPEGEGFRDPDAELGERIVAGKDPWEGRSDEAIERGNKIYHGLATCWSCHPAYVTRQEMATAIYELKKGQKLSSFRENVYYPEAKESQYEVPEAGGEAMRAVKLLPPDFWTNDIRSGTTLPDLFRVIGSGIQGTAMPAWKGSLPDEDIWAMSYYVQHLTKLKGSPKVGQLKAAMDADKAAITFPDEAAEDGSPTGM